MRAYRCYLLNKAALISAVEVIEGDGDAQQAALKMLCENSQHHTIEV